ncbi:hypothetical protein FZ103_09410 [Streptomonospora sp. PA3]|uniref:DUF6879 family protein n=1 Tax=Streptomonospora sp. PA3 TaxID=2607326 RepID=UPI0012DE2C04|nr:DUF6879 family protein [Streptomonospora sp. PA3]MUL41392.1 hypothetical protein [Streptomonospora sp. PA3]
MDRPEYHADLKQEYAARSGVFWKLERGQFFDEVGDSAWDAFRAGDWERVLAIFEGDRERVSRDVAAEAQRGVELRRLRIVEHPPSAYLRWETHSHLVFAECGRPIRVLDAEQVADLEGDGPLPELLLGGEVMYRVRYTADMTPDGAVRIDDREAVQEAEALVADLYERSEPLADYFRRVIAPLGPPAYTG